MAVEKITLNLIPTGETPTIHAAQFDKERAFQIELKEGEDDFSPTGYDIELQVRKVDNNIVTVVPSQVSSNIVTFLTTEQMTACSGTNLAELQISKDNMSIATLHFYLVVQRDVLAGGLSSQSDIYDLEEQIAAIVPEVIGDDYYTADQVDEKIAEIPTFDPTNYYDKSDVDALLNGKADVSDLPDMSNYYNKNEVDNKITDLYQIKTVSGSLIHITDGGDNIPLKSCEVTINPDLSGKTECNLSVADGDNVVQQTYTTSFGTTVYGGEGDVLSGEFTSAYVKVDLGSLTWTKGQTSQGNYRFFSSDLSSVIKRPATNDDVANLVCSDYQAKSFYDVNNNNTQGIYCHTNGSIGIYDSSKESLTDLQFQTAMNGVYLVYEVKNPTSLSLTPVNPKTISGVNNIYNDCGDTAIEYFTSSADGIAELIKAFM